MERGFSLIRRILKADFNIAYSDMIFRLLNLNPLAEGKYYPVLESVIIRSISENLRPINF